jgi:hypothetical protein
MEFTYLLIFSLYAICGYLLHKQVKILRMLKEQDITHKKSLAEAGSAITETLKVAFDNLKKNSNDHNKFNTKIVEHNSRIHRVEQHISRTDKNFDNKKVKADDEVAFTRRKIKDGDENENE